MRNDPRWLLVRYPCDCAKCTAFIPKGATGFYYPSTKAMYCAVCGKDASKDFESILFDEAQYNR